MKIERTSGADFSAAKRFHGRFVVFSLETCSKYTAHACKILLYFFFFCCCFCESKLLFFSIQKALYIIIKNNRWPCLDQTTTTRKKAGDRDRPRVREFCCWVVCNTRATTTGFALSPIFFFVFISPAFEFLFSVLMAQSHPSSFFLYLHV